MTGNLQIAVDRRALIQGLIAAVGFCACYGDADNVNAQDGLIFLDLPAPGDALAPTFEIFLALSKILLVRETVNETVGRKIFDLLVGEPWGAKHIGTAYAILYRHVVHLREPAGGNMLGKAPLPEGERWFIGHVITTWYIGVYYHPERPTSWLTLRDALMYEPVRDILPEPYAGSTGFGAWAEPPHSVKRK